jgi:hypothetical protein
MRLTLLLRLNSALWSILGLLLLLITPSVNALLGTEKTMLMHSIGIILVFNGMIILMASLRQQIKPHEIMFVVIGDYGWTLLTLVLISAGAVIIDPTGIRVAFVVALVSAAMGALQFRHYKLLIGRSYPS